MSIETSSMLPADAVVMQCCSRKLNAAVRGAQRFAFAASAPAAPRRSSRGSTDCQRSPPTLPRLGAGVAGADVQVNTGRSQHVHDDI